MDDATLWILGFIIVTMQALNSYLTGRVGAHAAPIAGYIRQNGFDEHRESLDSKVDTLAEHLHEIQNILGDMADMAEGIGADGFESSGGFSAPAVDQHQGSLGELVKSAMLSQVLSSFTHGSEQQRPIYNPQESHSSEESDQSSPSSEETGPQHPTD